MKIKIRTPKQATKEVYFWLLNRKNWIGNSEMMFHCFYHSLDLRYNGVHDAVKEYHRIKPTINILEVSEKKFNRRKNLNYRFKNIYSNPLVNDYIKSKQRGRIKAVYHDRISFYSRNHWAKNKQDLKVLEILQKHFKK